MENPTTNRTNKPSTHTPPARHLWHTAALFADWVNKNCITCRWRYRPMPTKNPPEPCYIVTKCLTDLIHDDIVSPDVIATIYGPKLCSQHPLPTPAPYRCYSRCDKRGRPPHNPAF